MWAGLVGWLFLMCICCILIESEENLGGPVSDGNSPVLIQLVLLPLPTVGRVHTKTPPVSIFGYVTEMPVRNLWYVELLQKLL